MNKLQSIKTTWIKNFKENKAAYLFILPVVLTIFGLQLIPMLQGFWLSFLDSNKSTIESYLAAPFIAFDNYYEILFNSASSVRQSLWDAIRNTIIYTSVVTIATMMIGLFAALLVNREFKGRNLARTLLICSWVVPSYVVGILWGFMWQQEDGIINILLFDYIHWDVISSWFGVMWEYGVNGDLIKPRWLTGENTIWAIIIPSVWRFWPYAMLMFLAGLSSISEDVYEAAQLDGSTRLEQFFFITFPMLKPVWVVLLMNGIINNVYSFNIVVMMFGNGSGFPGKHGDLIMTNIFRNSFQMWNFGVGAAMSAMLMTAMVVAVVVWYKRYREVLTNA